MTEPKPEPSPDATPQNPVPEASFDPNTLMASLNLSAIENEIESAFSSRMAELDEMLAGLDSLVAKIEKDVEAMDQPEQDQSQQDGTE